MFSFKEMHLECLGLSALDSPHKGQWRVALIFLWSVPEQTIEQAIEMLVIRDAIAPIMTSM